MAPGESNTQILGNYKLTQDENHKLGEGSLGTVYLAELVDVRKKVAARRIIVFKNYLNDSNFERDARMHLQRILPHKNLIKMHDILRCNFKDTIALWLITEYCPLGNLTDYAFRLELSHEQKLDLIYQWSLAVRHLHECKSKSNNVKPENILITGSPFRPEVKLTDFGIVKTVICTNKSSMIMQSFVGNNCWRAPEQSPTDKTFSYNNSVDTYSSALITLALLHSSKDKVMQPPFIRK